MRKSSKSRGKIDGNDFNFNNILSKQAYDNRFVYIWEDVDDEMLLSVTSKINLYLSKSKDKDITFLINSHGGYISSMQGILAEMDCAKKYVNVNTINMGVAYSAAASILINGTNGRRMAKPHTTIMFHPMSYGMSHDYATYQKKYTEFNDKQSSWLDEQLVSQLGITNPKEKTKFLNEVKDSLWLTAEEAVARKIIDKIYDDILPIVK